MLERIAAWLEGMEPQNGPVDDPVAWAAPLVRDGYLQLGCNGGRGALRLPDGGRLSCLAHLTWRDLLRLRGAGVSDLVLVWSAERCRSCPAAKPDLPGWMCGEPDSPPGFGLPVRVASEWSTMPASPSMVDLDRRQLLFGAMQSRLEQVRRAEPVPQTDWLAAGIRSLPAETPLPLPVRWIGVGCTFCGGCAHLCSALAVGDGQVTWQPAACTECDQCLTGCPAGVIGRGEPSLAGQWTQVLLLAQAERRTCGCGEGYYNNDPAAPCLRCQLIGQGSDDHGSSPTFF